MIQLQGKGVSSGVAFGPLQFLQRDDTPVEKRSIADVDAEIKRFEAARALAATQLAQLSVSMAEKLGQQNSLLFEIHQMMLEDLDYRDSVAGHIKSEKVCSEYAVSETAIEFEEMFRNMDDPYMQERAADVKDVSRRVIQILQGKGEVDSISTANQVILAADDFVPSETAQLDKTRVLAMATMHGSSNSHTAIFARTMGIPAVIGLGDTLKAEYEGKQIILDGDTGEVIVDPDAATTARFMGKQAEQDKDRTELEAFRGKPTVSADGRSVKLFANIGSPADMGAVLENDAEGVGLFRSEFLYLESSDYPSEEVQFKAYKEVAEKLNGKQVVIRTLDIGADKQASYFNLPHEENPAMGLRAIRICLTRPDIFKTQLRAIYRASAFGNIAIMFPMITSVSEVLRAKEIAAEARSELIAEGISFDKNLPIGIMIETPASAVISDLLAKEVAFFSIGTNDLTQYTLAVDRQNSAIDQFCDTHHEAVLRLIKLVADNAHKNGIWVGICGELGADQGLTQTFLNYGIDELSVAPSSVLPIRRLLSGLSVEKA